MGSQSKDRAPLTWLHRQEFLPLLTPSTQVLSPGLFAAEIPTGHLSYKQTISGMEGKKAHNRFYDERFRLEQNDTTEKIYEDENPGMMIFKMLGLPRHLFIVLLVPLFPLMFRSLLRLAWASWQWLG